MDRLLAGCKIVLTGLIPIGVGVLYLAATDFRLVDRCGNVSLGVMLIGLGLVFPFIGALGFTREQLWRRFFFAAMVLLAIALSDAKLGTHILNALMPEPCGK